MKVSIIQHSGSIAYVLASDVFAIDVVMESSREFTRDEILKESGTKPNQGHYNIKQLSKQIICKRNEIKTQMSVIFDSNLSGLNGSSRVTLLSRLSGFLTLPLDQFSVSSRCNTAFDVLQQNNILATGPGNKHTSRADSCGFLAVSWPLPCATHELLKQFPKVMSRNIASGHLTDASGYDILGWCIKKVENAVQRREKREAHMTVVPTPQPSQTATVVSFTSVLSSVFSSTLLTHSQATFSSSFQLSTVPSSSFYMTRTVLSTNPASPSVTVVTSASSPQILMSTSQTELPSSLTVSLTPSYALTQTILSTSEISTSSSSVVSSTAMSQVIDFSTILPEESSTILPSMPISQTSPLRQSETPFLSSSQLPGLSTTITFISSSGNIMTFISPSLNSSLHVSPTSIIGSTAPVASSQMLVSSPVMMMTSLIETSSQRQVVQSTLPMTTLPLSTLQSSQMSSDMLQSTSYASPDASSLLSSTSMSFFTQSVSSSTSRDMTVPLTLHTSVQSSPTGLISQLISSFQPRTVIISSLGISETMSLTSRSSFVGESSMLATDLSSSDFLYSSVFPSVSSSRVESPVYHTTEVASTASSGMSTTASMPSTLSGSSALQSTVASSALISSSEGRTSVPFLVSTSVETGSLERTMSISLSTTTVPLSTMPILSSLFSTGVKSSPLVMSTRDASASLSDYMYITSATFPPTLGPSDILVTSSIQSESVTGVFTVTTPSHLQLTTSTGMPSIALSTLTSSGTPVFTFTGESSSVFTTASSAESLSTHIISSTSVFNELTLSPSLVSSTIFSPTMRTSEGFISTIGSRETTQTSSPSSIIFTSRSSLLPTAFSSESLSTQRMSSTVSGNSLSPSSGKSGLSTVVSTSPMLSTSGVGTLTLSMGVSKLSSVPLRSSLHVISTSSQLSPPGPTLRTEVSHSLLSTRASAMSTGSLTSLPVESTSSQIYQSTLSSPSLQSDVTVITPALTSSVQIPPSTDTISSTSSLALTFSTVSLTSQRSTHMLTSGYLASTGQLTSLHSSTSDQTSTLYNVTMPTSFTFSGRSESPFSTPSAVASSRVVSSMDQSSSPQILTRTTDQSQSSLLLSTLSSRPEFSVMSTPSMLQMSSVKTEISLQSTRSLLSLPTMTEMPHSQLQTNTFILQTSSAAGSQSILPVSSGQSSVSSGFSSVVSSPFILSTQVSSSATVYSTSAGDAISSSATVYSTSAGDAYFSSATVYSTSAGDAFSSSATVYSTSAGDAFSSSATLYSTSAGAVSSSSETLQSTLLPSPTMPAPTSVAGSTPVLSSLPSSDYVSSSLPSLMSTSDLPTMTSTSSQVDVSSSHLLMTSNPTTQAPVVTTGNMSHLFDSILHSHMICKG